MNKIVKYLIIFLIIDVVAFGGYFALKALLKGPDAGETDQAEWMVMDEYYTPRDFIERFIFMEAEAQGLLPVSIKNYGRDQKALKRFRGRNFAGPNEAQLTMMFSGMEDWRLVELKYTDEKDREVQRAVLYILIDENWRVGDSGTLQPRS